MTSFIPFALPDIGDEEIRAAADTLRSGWLTSGPCVSRFEKEFRRYVSAPHALAVNSGSAALHLALVALGIGPGDEVITTPFTFCATINAILETGATPILADIQADLNIDPAGIRKAITERTRAILPVHVGGLPCKMDQIWEIAAKHRLYVVEDAAHASGSAFGGTPIGGGISDAVAYSFYATKNLCTGEGGMVVTPSADLHARMKTLSLHGISRDAWNRYAEHANWFYEVVERGYKYNMGDLTAAIGIEQLAKLDRMNARRAQIAAAYNEAFAEMPELEIPPTRPDSYHSWHLYVLRLNLERLSMNRSMFFEEMRQLGIGCSVHFIPIPMHPYYRDRLELRDPCLRAMSEYARLLSLPIYSKMADSEVHRVIDAVRHISRRAALSPCESPPRDTGLRAESGYSPTVITAAGPAHE